MLHGWSIARWLGLAWIAFCAEAGSNKGAPPIDYSNHRCTVTHGAPVSLTPLSGIMSFCTAFTNGRCCIPIHDEYIKDTFYSILSAGSICAAAPNVALVTLKAIQCTACNPAVSLYLSTPRNASFFSAPQTLKVCAAAAAAVSPHRFNDCGLVYIGSRNSICLPNIPIAPSIVFPGCEDGDHVCYSTTKGDYSPIWYCSKTPCGVVDTPLGFRDVACHGPSCTASFQFLNDNRGAKPPFFEMFPVEIIDETSCDDAANCCVTDPRLEAST